MKTNYKNWSKEELKIYILLVCASADGEQSEEEINFIKSKTSKDLFEKMHTEFKGDKKKKSFKKIERAVGNLDYGSLELLELRKEILEVYMADKTFHKKEKYLDRILDNIIF
ncbi:hypothetical protein ES731_12465 [Psychroflexus gondwanensis]|jgi:hypothetical protein|uniref:hypothetical protein n=1 Tax=Psychroflexus gondwanensis TaxID=251 RepID=UPI0011BD8310|nr:hypothetical protein [Psychroflexus gondwanensis]TXE17227.1 hypothetical protein ES731_12465 [Psychroflexus gondwanensis]